MRPVVVTKVSSMILFCDGLRCENEVAVNVPDSLLAQSVCSDLNRDRMPCLCGGPMAEELRAQLLRNEAFWDEMEMRFTLRTDPVYMDVLREWCMLPSPYESLG